MIPFSIVDVSGVKHEFGDGKTQIGLVAVFVTTDCPIANSYQPGLRELVAEFSDRGFRFVEIYAHATTTREQIDKHVRDFDIAMPVVLDNSRSIAKRLGATVTPEVVIVDHQGDVCYRGRIDDRYPDYGKKRATPTRRDLREALLELTSGKIVSVPTTKAVGCRIHFD